MTQMETKIIEAVREKAEWMNRFDADRQAEYDEYMERAEQQTSEWWKKDFEHKAEWALGFQKHGYLFLTDWMNVISNAMYGRTFHEWHSAQAGRYKGTGHGAYSTSELNEEEGAKVKKVFEGMVRQGYFRISKSGKQAKFTR